MKQTIVLKQIDLLAQLVAVLIPAIYMLWGNSVEYMFIAYFSVGGVQVISVVLNALFFRHRLSPGRNLYLLALLAIVVLGVAAMTADADTQFLYLMFMLFAGVVMAIWYCMITFLELLNVRAASKP